MLPSLEMFCPFVSAARLWSKLPIKYLVTFQGYEVYGCYAKAIGIHKRLLEVIRKSVEESDFRAIAVGELYSRRIQNEIGLRADQLITISPCVDPPQIVRKEQAERLVRRQFPAFRPGVPLITYLGRQDAEKGIDLLLYSASICQQEGLDFQLLVCGPSAHGRAYQDVCRQIASHLRLDVMWGGYVSDDVRSAIFQLSTIAVYPSIHGEPFGMAPLEAALHGAAVIVVENSGVAAENPTMLTFPSGNTQILATRIRNVLDTPRTPRPEALALAFETAEQMSNRIRCTLELPVDQKSICIGQCEVSECQ
jgi:glycosyltransferase involved in cell wall biosynthesis